MVSKVLWQGTRAILIDIEEPSRAIQTDLFSSFPRDQKWVGCDSRMGVLGPFVTFVVLLEVIFLALGL